MSDHPDGLVCLEPIRVRDRVGKNFHIQILSDFVEIRGVYNRKIFPMENFHGLTKKNQGFCLIF